MPWKNQGGGPWGSGSKGPWGSGPQPVGPRPPDLEDLLRRGQDRLQQLLPGGHFSSLGITLVLAGAVAIWALTGFYRVQSEEVGVVLRFGKYVGDAHLYSNHLEQARLQLTRPTRALPSMQINPAVKDIFAFRYEDFKLENYDPHPHIKAEVAV